MKKADIVRKALLMAWGDGEPTGRTKAVLEGSDRTVLRHYARHEAALAGPMQTVLEETYRIHEGGMPPKRFQDLYLHLDRVLLGVER